MIFGLPKRLLWGYVALAIFMAGDGFDLTFLSRYLVVEFGYTPSQAGLAFTVYGFTAGFAAWSTGVVAEAIGAKKMMIIGGVLWILLHAQFLLIGLGNPTATAITYGIRGIAYPLFMYSFVVLIAQEVPAHKLASAMGWFWCAFSLGIGTLGSLIPTITLSRIGEYATLWLAIVFVAVGVLICMIAVPGHKDKAQTDTDKNTPQAEIRHSRMRELARGITILWERPVISLAVIIRILCNLTLYGFPVVMPLYLTGKIAGSDAWYSLEEWMTAWAIMNTTCIFANVIWGRLGDRYGWMRQMQWWGFGGIALAALSFYYLPIMTDGSYFALVISALIFGTFVCSFVPMGAIFPALAPDHRGAAISAHNMASGLTTFIGPGIVTVFLPLIGIGGVIWVYVGLFALGTLTCFFIRPPQKGITDAHGRLLPAAERRAYRRNGALAESNPAAPSAA